MTDRSDGTSETAVQRFAKELFQPDNWPLRVQSLALNAGVLLFGFALGIKYYAAYATQLVAENPELAGQALLNDLSDKALEIQWFVFAAGVLLVLAISIDIWRAGRDGDA